MPDEKLGIEHLKTLVTVGLQVPKSIAEVTADGKVSLIEIVGLVPIATEVIATAKQWKDIVAELKDLDDTERDELHTFFAEKFDIPNDKVEAFVEDALGVGFNIVSLVARFKDLK